MTKNANQSKPGILYGVGVGPGDPELIPLKAIRVLRSVDIIFTASSSKNDCSLALSIAKPYLPEQVPIRRLPFPMTFDSSDKMKAWEEHTRTMIRELEAGYTLAFLTLGDPLTYSTYGYIAKNMRRLAPHLKLETIPGITSYQACAAAINTPLVEGEEKLLILSGAKGGQGLGSLAREIDNVVFLKAYKHMTDIFRT
jgi:precorrin-2/cobalt-factor-2 C20-methyltransferase